MSGNALATLLAIASGLAGSLQVAVMSRLGERIGIWEALGFSTILTAGLAFALLVVTRFSVSGYGRAVHQPWWMLTGGGLSFLIVLTITYAGPRIGVTATIGIIIAFQLVMATMIDRFGWFGGERIGLHWWRVLGIALLAVGAALSLRK